jgi:hypothetical protein
MLLCPDCNRLEEEFKYSFAASTVETRAPTAIPPLAIESQEKRFLHFHSEGYLNLGHFFVLL